MTGSFGRSRVGRNVELAGDLLESEFAPDFEDQHLALFDGKAPESDLDLGAAVVAFPQRFEKRAAFDFVACHLFLAGGAT